MMKTIKTLTIWLAVLAMMASHVQAQKGQGQRGAANRGKGRSGQPAGQGNPRGNSGQAGSRDASGGRGNQAGKGIQNGNLTAAERSQLTRMREEEKLARDVYLALNAKWGLNVFANISRAEQQHMQVVGQALQRYGVPDPVTNDQQGVFQSATFQQLYVELVQAGSASQIDAIKVGLKIEEMDIADLRVALKQTQQPDLTRIFTNLERGSRNHLRAFAGQLVQLGGSYQPTSLSTEAFNQILTESNGQGNRGGQRGQGQGQGGGNQPNGQRGQGMQGGSGRGGQQGGTSRGGQGRGGQGRERRGG